MAVYGKKSVTLNKPHRASGKDAVHHKSGHRKATLSLLPGLLGLLTAPSPPTHMPGVVYVRGDNGKVKKVLFGDPHMRIRKNEAGHRASFRARHHCENPGPKTKARYWSCRAW